MSHELPDPHTERIPEATKAAQELRARVARGSTSTVKFAAPEVADSAGEPSGTLDPEWEPASGASPAPERWWQYMPSESQLLQFLAMWLQRRKSQKKTVLHVPLAGAVGVTANAQIPITTYFASVTQAQILLLVDPELGGLQLPPGFALQLDMGEGTCAPVVYLGSFHPLPGFPFAVMSFLSDDSYGENRSH